MIDLNCTNSIIQINVPMRVSGSDQLLIHNVLFIASTTNLLLPGTSTRHNNAVLTVVVNVSGRIVWKLPKTSIMLCYANKTSVHCALFQHKYPVYLWTNLPDVWRNQNHGSWLNQNASIQRDWKQLAAFEKSTKL